MNIENVQKAINQIETIEEMEQVIYLLKQRQHALQTIQTAINKSLLSVGSKVEIPSPRGKEIGEVIEIKRTKAIVDIDGQRYNCPMSILEAV
jgi:hypothetical protein